MPVLATAAAGALAVHYASLEHATAPLAAHVATLGGVAGMLAVPGAAIIHLVAHASLPSCRPGLISVFYTRSNRTARHPKSLYDLCLQKADW